MSSNDISAYVFLAFMALMAFGGAIVFMGDTRKLIESKNYFELILTIPIFMCAVLFLGAIPYAYVRDHHWLQHPEQQDVQIIIKPYYLDVETQMLNPPTVSLQGRLVQCRSWERSIEESYEERPYHCDWDSSYKMAKSLNFPDDHP